MQEYAREREKEREKVTKGVARIAHINDNAGCLMKCRVCASHLCPSLPQRQPRETLSRRRRGVVQLLISSPRPHTSTRRGWLPRRPSTTTVIVAVCQERGKPSDDGVNWATIVPPPPLLFLSLLRDTRAR